MKSEALERVLNCLDCSIGERALSKHDGPCDYHEARAELDALLAEAASAFEGLEWLRDDIAVKVETIAVLTSALRALRGWAYVESIAHGIVMPPNLAALLDRALDESGAQPPMPPPPDIRTPNPPLR